MIVRTSMQYQSVISAIPNINSNKNLSLMKNIFNENRYRLCVLIGGNCKKVLMEVYLDLIGNKYIYIIIMILQECLLVF